MRLLFSSLIYISIVLNFAAYFLAYVLLFRRRRIPVYVYFGFTLLFIGLWFTITLLDVFRFTPLSSVIHAILGFTISIWILHYFLLFTFYYPVPLKREYKVIKWLYLATALVSLSTLIPGLYVISASVEFPYKYREIQTIGLSLFTGYFCFLAVYAFYNLFTRLRRSDGIHRENLRKIIWGTLFAIVVNLVFSLFNYYQSNFDLTVIGLVSTFSVLAYVFFILYFLK